VDVTAPVRLSLTDEERTRALADGIPSAHTFALKPRAAEIRVVARDVATGRVGSLVIPVARIQ
jgi:hypothetical protein